MKTRSKYRVIMFCLGLIFVLAFGMLIAANACQAEDSNFSWIPNQEADLAGYKIHYGPSPRNYVTTVDCGLPATGPDGRVAYKVENTPTEMTYYAATAYDLAGNESDYSDEVNNDSAPGAPGGFIRVVVETETRTTVTVN